MHELAIKWDVKCTYQFTANIVHEHKRGSDVSRRAVGECRRGVILPIDGELGRTCPGKMRESLELGLVVASLVEETLDVSSGRIMTARAKRAGTVAQLGKLDELVRMG